MSSAASQPDHLRLVGADDPQALATWRTARQARQDVIRENRLAASNATLDPADPRWVLAAKTYAHLDGATLTPERRERLIRTAKRLGLRAFDANLVIAVVQDHARRGQAPQDAVSSLKMIEGRPTPPDTAATLRWISAVLCAITATTLLIWWLTAGS